MRPRQVTQDVSVFLSVGRLLRDTLRTFILMPPRICYWRIHRKRWPHVHIRSFWRSIRFLFDRSLPLSFLTRWALIERFIRINQTVDCPHTTDEMLEVSSAILRLAQSTPGVVIEAGAYQGGSTAKISLCALLAGRKLIVFDSFEGIPENSEVQSTAGCPTIVFKPGSYAGSLEQVKDIIGSYGSLAVCEFVKGWFSDTMPKFDRPIATGYLDVDLVSSTSDCLTHLYPHLIPGGTLFSQDGHLNKVIELLDDDDFWATKVGVRKPPMNGLRKRKLVKITKPGLIQNSAG